MENIYFLNWLTLAVAISATAFVLIVASEGNLLGGLNYKLEKKLPDYIWKPLIGCQYCVSGQWALWFYFYLSLVENRVEYVWWLHLWFIMQTIFVVKIITYIYGKIDE